MFRSTRHIIRFLILLLPVFLVACGKNSTGPSSGVLGGHSAVDVAGTVWTFGANGFGQLGNGNMTDSHTPVNVGSYAQVAIGGGHTVALDSSGNVFTWGYNSNGQLGNGNTSNSSTRVPVTIALTGGAKIIQVSAGARFTLALADDGSVWAWGNNNRGQLGQGNGDTADRSAPVQVKNLPTGVTIIAVAAGGEFALACGNDGSVWAWGANDNGQLGNSSAVAGVPVNVLSSTTGNPPLSNINKIAAGGMHALAIDGSGNIWAWGYNYAGQVGDGTTVNKTTAVVVWDVSSPANTGLVAKSISAGLDHTLAIIGAAAATSGSVYAWGYNFFGQIGNAATLYTNDFITSPLKVLDGSQTGFASIIATGNHSIAIDSGNHIWTWGMNTYGQLGDNTTTDRSTPAIVPGH